MKHLILTLLMGCLFSSCDKKPFYQKSYSFKNNTWNQNEETTFKVKIDDTTAVYRFILTLRTETDYKYNNVWLFWNTISPTNETAREGFEIKISDPTNGKLYGKKAGTVVENQLTFANRKMPNPGVYTFKIEQAVTVEKLENVLDLGLQVYKNN